MHPEPSIKILRGVTHPSDESARRLAQRPSKSGVDLRIWLVRDRSLLQRPSESSASRDELPISEVMAAAVAANDRPGAFLVGGGDPLRRGDLWQLLRALHELRPANLGVCTPGPALTRSMAERLRAAGVARLQVPFHCARQDAHDWLVGQPGALKAAHRAIRVCIENELPVTAEVVLSRPTAPHLAETVEVLAHLGVRNICVRRLTADDAAGASFVPLSPRLSLLAEPLEQAAAIAVKRRVKLTVRDLPVCVAPRLRTIFASTGSERWASTSRPVEPRGQGGIGCSTCPGLPHCSGAPQDYVARFAWEEFIDPMSATLRVSEDVPRQQAAIGSEPMSFTWGGPHRVRCEACGDTSSAGEKTTPSGEPTRIVRTRLVQAAFYRPAVVRLIGADLLAHPQSALLIYDALRLFPRVEIAGEASPMVDWSDLDLRRMKELGRIDVALYGPDAATHDAHCGIPGAFAAMQRGVERLRSQTSIPVGAYAILHDARFVAAFAEAWTRGDLPGEPRFRLSARGASLDELVESTRAFEPGAVRSALLAVLPRCLMAQAGMPVDGDAKPEHAWTSHRTVHFGRSLPYQPSGSDPFGQFEGCREGAETCGTPGCRGTAAGWHSTARSKPWTMSI